MEALLSTAEAARLAGVGTTSVKRWADEGLLDCQKTAGGHRRFLRAELERFLRAQPGATLPPSAGAWADRMMQANAYELRAALWEARGRKGSFHAVCDELAPAFGELGARWACGSVSVLDEHVASERISRALSHACDAVPVAESAPACLLACAEGDEHTLGLALAELCLREAGWNAVWAGRHTPTLDIVRAVERGDCELVALSASTVPPARALAGQARTLERTCEAAGIPLVLGGSGAWPSTLTYARRFADFSAFFEFLKTLRA